MAGPATTRVLASAPRSVPLLVKAALPGVPGLGSLPGVRRSGEALPSLTLARGDVAVDRDHVGRYGEVCGFPARDTLPLPYPHLVAFPLHLALMTDRAFPFPALGTVHLENAITQHRAIGVQERLAVRVWAENVRGHPKGRAYDVRTEVQAGDDLVWEERSTFLVRGPGDASAPAGLELEPVPPGGTTWRLPADLGRRYAAVSGDHNPIHLYRLTAKAFGFPRQIAHGMWSLARCVAHLENRLPEAVTVEVAFTKPLLLPATVAFGCRIEHVDGRPQAAFSLSNPRTGAAHLVGRGR